MGLHLRLEGMSVCWHTLFFALSPGIGVPPLYAGRRYAFFIVRFWNVSTKKEKKERQKHGKMHQLRH